MKPTLENVASAWSLADPARRAAALRALQGGAEQPADNGARVLRWRVAAERAGICRKRLRDACRTAGVRPVVLPGSQRAIGIRERDLVAVIGE